MFTKKTFIILSVITLVLNIVLYFVSGYVYGGLDIYLPWIFLEIGVYGMVIIYLIQKHAEEKKWCLFSPFDE
jgi:hypothetical protein